MIEFRDEIARDAGVRPARPHQPGGRRARHQSVRSRLARTPTCDEDRRPEAGAGQVRLRRGVRRRAPRRGEEPRQGAHLLLPLGQPPLGPEEPAAGAVERSTMRASTKGECIRVFPLSNWTELDIWQYIQAENIPIVPLYFAKKRPVVERDGTLMMVDDERMPLQPGETAGRALGALPHPRLLSAHRRDRERGATRCRRSSARCCIATHLGAPGPRRSTTTKPPRWRRRSRRAISDGRTALRISEGSEAPARSRCLSSRAGEIPAALPDLRLRSMTASRR